EVGVRALFDTPTLGRFAAGLPGQPSASRPIQAVPRTGPVPLSFAQQRLWFLDEYEPGGTEYISPTALRLRGELDVDTLHRALNVVVARHESLRTTFDTIDGHGVQLIHDPRPVELVVSDFEDGMLEREIRRPFDLRTGPLLRALLFRREPDDHVLLLVLHHIVTDGWSSEILIGELATVYTAFVRGAEPELPEPLIQYADFAVWQREEADIDAQLEYWRGRLDGVPRLELPTDRPRPPVRANHGAVHEFAVPAATTARLKDLSRRHGGTLFMTVLAACQVLFSRWSGQDDVALGTVVAGRGRAELEGLIGFFVNTVVLRSTVKASESVADLLGRARQTALDAFAHDEVPFERVVDAVHAERNPGRNPLFDVLLVLQSAPAAQPTFGGMNAEPVELRREAANFDLTCEFAEIGDVLAGSVEYRTDLFDAATIDRMTGHLLRLLDGIAADPGCRVGDLPMLTDAEERQLRQWASTDVDVPDTTVVELLESQVRLRPDETALVCGDVSMTYAELVARVSTLAADLVARGAGPERVVAVMLPRSAESIVAMFAVLKAGAVYLPIDPGLPEERVRFLLEDARPAAVLDGREWLSGVEPRLPLTTPTSQPQPGDAAYVIYTSGSTGTPKGVVVGHAAMVNLVANHRAVFGRERMRVALTAALSFDASWEQPLMMADGHELHLIDDDTRLDPIALTRYLHERRIDFADVTPSYLKHLLPAGLLTDERRPKNLMVAGEAIDEALWRELAASPGNPPFNFYGPTESTVDATFARVTGVRPLIGRPIGNVGAYVLDDALRLVPPGVPGELCLGGAQLARGYLNRPGLTADRFVANPFGEPGTRLYRTGDRVRWTADGQLEYLGRLDDQVKIRGFRIEPGEIETALLGHPGVTEAAVVANDGRLVAYVVGDADPADLREHLKEMLPAYLMPSAFVSLDGLPLTHHGKLDRRALPEPERSATAPYVAPRTECERLLCELWAEVLGVERVGVEDNFFGLGGDSILSIQVVAKARQAGLSLSTKDIFLHQTIGELAPAARADVPGAAVAEIAGPAPLGPIQRWLFETLDEPWRMTMSVHIRLSEVDAPRLARALARVSEHHSALRMRFWQEAGEWWQEAAGGPAEILRQVDLSDVDDPAAVMHAEAIRAQESLDIGAGRVWQAVLFTFADRPPQLFITAHHLVMDGVSWRILLGDLERAYRDEELDPVGTSFAHWARSLAEQVDALEGELAYWKAVSDGATVELPADRAGRNLAGTTRTVSVSLSRAETAALLQEVPGAYRTEVNDVLLAALGRVLARWTGRNRVAVALEGHGREEIVDGLDLSRTIGWFTAQYPVALTVPDGDWGAVLKAVKENLRAVPNKGVGYGALRYLRPDSPLRNQPEPQISFNYHGRFDVAPAGESLYRERCESLGNDLAPESPRPCL
ncbi:MAG TPA: amino acid adenylation domain-containing protein, partial [Amycolatopsis sp.]|nr:amino acid adenylation domain-containing protein [Amycolatopsis sp.]